MINRFSHEYRWLSNYYPSVICIDGITYATVEHAYHASKALDFSDKIRISRLISPIEARFLSYRIPIRPEWDDSLRLSTMENILRLKFIPGSKLSYRLINTYPIILTDNNIVDSFWSLMDDNTGENNLGKILMNIREDLRNNHSIDEVYTNLETNIVFKTISKVYPTSENSGYIEITGTLNSKTISLGLEIDKAAYQKLLEGLNIDLVSETKKFLKAELTYQLYKEVLNERPSAKLDIVKELS